VATPFPDLFFFRLSGWASFLLSLRSSPGFLIFLTIEVSLLVHSNSLVAYGSFLEFFKGSPDHFSSCLVTLCFFSTHSVPLCCPPYKPAFSPGAPGHSFFSRVSVLLTCLSPKDRFLKFIRSTRFPSPSFPFFLPGKCFFTAIVKYQRRHSPSSSRCRRSL